MKHKSEEEPMGEFQDEVYIKKQIASGAYHKRSGAKSHKCSLPSDKLTNKQISKMSGAVKTYQLGKPMTWDAFKAMPDDLQLLYIKRLIEKYGATNTCIAHMFGVTPSCVCHKLTSMGIHRARRKQMTDDQAAEWEAFEVSK